MYYACDTLSNGGNENWRQPEKYSRWKFFFEWNFLLRSGEWEGQCEKSTFLWAKYASPSPFYGAQRPKVSLNFTWPPYELPVSKIGTLLHLTNKYPHCQLCVRVWHFLLSFFLLRQFEIIYQYSIMNVWLGSPLAQFGFVVSVSQSHSRLANYLCVSIQCLSCCYCCWYSWYIERATIFNYTIHKM